MILALELTTKMHGCTMLRYFIFLHFSYLFFLPQLTFVKQASKYVSTSTVVIPRGCFYALNSPSLSVTTGDLYVNGTLRCTNHGNPNYSFLSKKIWVYGALQCGTQALPFNGTLSITLYGAKPAVGQTDLYVLLRNLIYYRFLSR
jgi:hypothetical protein